MAGDDRAQTPEGAGLLLDALERLPLPALVSDPRRPGHPVVRANAALLALAGRTALAGPMPGALLAGAPEAILAEIGAALAAGRPLALALPAGADLPPAALALAPALDATGRPLLTLWTFADRTEACEAQATLALVRAQGRSREALGQLTNSVAHEFNNILQILVGYVDGLRRRLGTSEDKFIQRALTRSTEAAERGATLTNRLLAHARRTRPEAGLVDLNALVAEALARTPAGGGIALAATLAPDLPPVVCDALQVDVALDAVLANAREATAAGGRITVATHLRDASASEAAGPARAAVVEVSDTGEGMAPEVLARAADPFFTTRAPGRGTGLAVVQGLMRRVGGHLALESAPDAGTTVRLAFPLAEGDARTSG